MSAPAEGLFPESRPEIPTDDWDDQDLLTKDEARLRLDHTAAQVRNQLTGTDAADYDKIAELTEQLARIQRVLDIIDARTGVERTEHA